MTEAANSCSSLPEGGMTDDRETESWKRPLIPPLPPAISMFPSAPVPSLLPDALKLLRFPAFPYWPLPQFSPLANRSIRPKLQTEALASSTQSLQMPSPTKPLPEDGVRGVSISKSESVNNELFKSGTVLSCGADGSSVKRVDDLTAEDFVLSERLQQRYNLEYCRIVWMQDVNDCVVIHLTPGDIDQTRVIQLLSTQPLFVPGSGWASRQPDLTLRRHGLRCRTLMVGDRVASLVPKDPSVPVESGNGVGRSRPGKRRRRTLTDDGNEDQTEGDEQERQDLENEGKC